MLCFVGAVLVAHAQARRRSFQQSAVKAAPRPLYQCCMQRTAACDHVFCLLGLTEPEALSCILKACIQHCHQQVAYTRSATATHTRNVRDVEWPPPDHARPRMSAAHRSPTPSGFCQHSLTPVSYTHWTLPPTRDGEIREGAVNAKKKI